MSTAQNTSTRFTGWTDDQAEYRRAVWAMTAVGLSAFIMLYSTQGLIPLLQSDYGIPPHVAATTIGATTGTMALAILPAAIASERFGRGRIILIGLTGAVLFGILASLAPSIETLIAVRALQGLMLSGIPAAAMAWLADEINPLDLPKAMGLYIAGNTVGGLLGRLIPTGLLEFVPWRWALAGNTLVAAILAAWAFSRLPDQRGFTKKSIRLTEETRAIIGHLRNPILLGCFTLAFILMGSFVSLYNYIGIRLIDVFGLSPTLAGFIFILYLCGTASAAYGGKLATRIGRPAVIFTGIACMTTGFLILMIDNLTTTIIGVALVTAGLFFAHSIASGWVGAAAKGNRGEASGTYLGAYYLGSSVVGVSTGLVFHQGGWTVFLCVLLAAMVFATVITTALARTSARP